MDTGHLALVLRPHSCYSPRPWKSCGLWLGYTDTSKSEGLRSLTWKYRSGHRRTCMVYPCSLLHLERRLLDSWGTYQAQFPQSLRALHSSVEALFLQTFGLVVPSSHFIISPIVTSAERPCPFWPPVLTSTHIILYSLIIYIFFFFKAFWTLLLSSGFMYPLGIICHHPPPRRISPWRWDLYLFCFSLKWPTSGTMPGTVGTQPIFLNKWINT